MQGAAIRCANPHRAPRSIARRGRNPLLLFAPPQLIRRPKAKPAAASWAPGARSARRSSPGLAQFVPWEASILAFRALPRSRAEKQKARLHLAAHSKHSIFRIAI